MLSAQEARGWLIGRISDASGAVVAGAKVTATNLAQNTHTSTRTNAEGNYELPYLLPGQYSVMVEMAGFAKAMRERVAVEIGERMTLDFELQVGSTAESVTVSAEAPLIDTSNASNSMLMDERRVKELPVVGGNATYLTRLSPGITVTGGHSAGNPTDYGGASGSVVVNGVRTGNSEITLDGTPNMQQTNSAYSPPQDLVQEFKVQTTTYDASLGHAAGAVVNVSMKSGGNRLSGTAYMYDSRIRAVPWFSNRWLYDATTGPIDDAKRRQANPGWLHQRWGASASGPVVIPHLYDGHNRTFWTFGYEGLHIERQPTFFATVPTEAERSGDFSALLKVGSQYQIYDPYTISLAPGGRTSRQPLAGNVIPAARVSAVAQKILGFYPKPNTAGTVDGRQNYFGVQKEPKTYHGFVSRIDHNFSEKHRFYARWNATTYQTGVQRLPNIAFGDQTSQRAFGVVLDDVYVFSPQLLLNLRAGFTYFRNRDYPNSQGFDITTLGWPKSLVSQITAVDPAAALAFPNVVTESSAYEDMSGDGGTRRATPYQSYQGTVTRIAGNHSLRMGGDFRVQRETGYGYGNVAPRLEFGNAYTKGPLDSSPGAPIGQGLASMLFDIPTGGRVNVNSSRAQQGTYSALFLQDDWRVTRKLTINAGMRYEYEGPLTERYNRSIRTFDYVTPSPISAAALANYTKNPILEITPSSFRTVGGLLFAGVGNQPRALWKPDRNNFGPRLGLAWSVDSKTVIRAGYGVFFGSLGGDRRDVNQGGFNQPTNVEPTRDNGLTWQATLAAPFPRGIDMAPGASGGLNTFLGRGVSYFEENAATPYMQRWSVSVQRELGWRSVLDVTYVGNRGTKLGATREYDTVSRSYLSTSPVRDQATIDFLTAQVANPFYGLPEFVGTGLANNRVARTNILSAYPHFQGVSVSQPNGSSWYHGLQVLFMKRLGHGLTLQSSYTWSKFMEATAYLNDTDTAPEHVISDQDYPQRFTISGIYELPIGKGKPIYGSAGRFADYLVGGWQVQGWYEGQSGQALGFGNVTFYGKLSDIPLPIGERSADRWFNTDAGFERSTQKALANNIRTMSTRFTGVRSDGINNLDASMFKSFRLTERFTAQFRMESYNAANHAQFANPVTGVTNSAFGKVNGEKGHGQRQLTFAVRLRF